MGADAPWQEPPESEQIPHGTHWWDHTWGSMLNAVDNGIGNVTKALQAADMWDDTLIVRETSLSLSAWAWMIYLPRLEAQA